MAMPLFAQDARRTAVIWQDRGDIAASGPGGRPGRQRPRAGRRLHVPEGVDERHVAEVRRARTNTAPRGRSRSAKRPDRRRPPRASSGPQGTWSMRTISGRGFTSADCHASPAARSSCRRVTSSTGRASNATAEARIRRSGTGTTIPLSARASSTASGSMMALVNNWDLKAINNAATGLAAGDATVRHQRPRGDAGTHRQQPHAQQGSAEGLRRKPLHRQGHADVRRFRHAQPAVFRPSWSTSATTASARGWKAWSSTFRSPMPGGSAIGWDACHPNKSATASAPPASHPVMSTSYAQIVMERIAALEGLSVMGRPSLRTRKTSPVAVASHRRAARCRFAKR